MSKEEGIITNGYGPNSWGPFSRVQGPRQDVASIELEDESQHTQLFVNPEQPPRVRCAAVGSPELLPAAWPEAVEDEDEGSEDQEEDQEDQEDQDAEKAEGEDADETEEAEEVEEIEEVEGEEGEEGEEEECTEEQPWQLILFRGTRNLWNRWLDRANSWDPKRSNT